MKYWLVQVIRALSRLVNALLGGEGDCTFSAWSWQLKLTAEASGDAWRLRLAQLRIALVDGLMGRGHCAEAWSWHDAHGLLGREYEGDGHPMG